MKSTSGGEASADVQVEVQQQSSPLISRARVGLRYHTWSSIVGWLVFCWALIELPFELWVSTTWQEAAALSCAKVLLLSVVLAMFRGSVWAKVVFLGICLMSVLAITPTLPGAFRFFPVGAALSTGEVAVKLLALLVIVCEHSMRGQ
jgi:hypothetical protein